NSLHKVPSWVPSNAREAFRSFSVAFKDTVIAKCKMLEKEYANIWFEWTKCPKPEQALNKLVDEHKFGVSPFEQLLLVQMFRKDRLYLALHEFICNQLDIDSLCSTSRQHQLSERIRSEQQANANTTVLFITTAGADPSQELRDFADATVGLDHLVEIAMGSNQKEHCLLAIKEAAEKGNWICLKNLHLVTPWVNDIIKTVDSLQVLLLKKKRGKHIIIIIIILKNSFSIDFSI
ncbi:dynein heavy chain, partial [Reticulomyxa filosa]